MNILQDFFNSCVLEFQNSPAHNYLLDRRLSIDTPVGYCSTEVFDQYTRYDSLKYVIKALAIINENRVLEHRLVLPICSTNGELIAVGGRTLHNVKPKYYNSVYPKKKELFGLNLSIPLILKKGYAVVVEGYLDFYRLFYYKIPAVAILSASITPDQLIKLSRYTNRVILCLDNDSVGEKNSDKFLQQVHSLSSIIVTRVNLSKDEDPDSFINKFGIDKFRSKLATHLLIS